MTHAPTLVGRIGQSSDSELGGAEYERWRGIEPPSLELTLLVAAEGGPLLGTAGDGAHPETS